MAELSWQEPKEIARSDFRRRGWVLLPIIGAIWLLVFAVTALVNGALGQLLPWLAGHATAAHQAELLFAIRIANVLAALLLLLAVLLYLAAPTSTVALTAAGIELRGGVWQQTMPWDEISGAKLLPHPRCERAWLLRLEAPFGQSHDREHELIVPLAIAAKELRRVFRQHGVQLEVQAQSLQ